MRVQVDASLPIADLMAMGMSRPTAYRARKRGWYNRDYHHQEIKIDRSSFDAQLAYIAARTCYNRYFSSAPNWATRSSRDNHHSTKYHDDWKKEDFVQAAVLRCFELSGKANNYSYYFQVAQNTMRNLNKKRQETPLPLSIEVMEEAASVALYTGGKLCLTKKPAHNA